MDIESLQDEAKLLSSRKAELLRDQQQLSTALDTAEAQQQELSAGISVSHFAVVQLHPVIFACWRRFLTMEDTPQFPNLQHQLTQQSPGSTWIVNVATTNACVVIAGH